MIRVTAKQMDEALVYPTVQKRCSHCKEIKPRTEFHRAGNGHQGWCKVCRSATRDRVGQGPGHVKPRPFVDLPDRPREDGCATCGEKLRFNTDATSALTQECACGIRLVPMKGREKVRRHDQDERRQVELERFVASSIRPVPDPRWSHPTRHTARLYLNTRPLPRD